jgi:hypothetical protein
VNEGIETVHVVFGRCTADTLRNALPLLGSTERVIGLPDILSVGPINPPDPALRDAWFKSVLRTDTTLRAELDGDLIDVEAIWADATAPAVAPVFWVCFKSPMEHAAFLAFAARMQDRAFDIIDATNLDFTTTDGVHTPCSLGLMRVQDIVASKMYATRRPVSSDERRSATRTWSELQHANAPFRIVRDGRLVSAPLTHYDAVLVEQASQDWEIGARLIGRVITKLGFENAPHGQATSDDVIFGRMITLGERGALDVLGSGPDIRDYQVRRAAA